MVMSRRVGSARAQRTGKNISLIQRLSNKEVENGEQITAKSTELIPRRIVKSIGRSKMRQVALDGEISNVITIANITSDQRLGSARTNSKEHAAEETLSI